MDRPQQCKLLKKVYLKQRRHALWLWHSLTWLGFAVTLVAAFFYMDARFLGGHSVGLIGNAFGDWVLRFAPWVTLGGGILTLVFGLISRHKLSNLHKSSAYLDWRTLKTALATEKEEL